MFGNKIQKMVNKENVFAVVSWMWECENERWNGEKGINWGGNRLTDWLASWLDAIVVQRFSGHKK